MRRLSLQSIILTGVLLSAVGAVVGSAFGIETLALVASSDGGSVMRTDNLIAVQAGNVIALAKHMQWPEASFETPQSPLVIGVIRNDEFAAALRKQNKERPIGEHPVRIMEYDTYETALKSHIVCAIGLRAEQVEGLLKAAKGRPVFLIGDGSDFLSGGGHIQFLSSRPHVKFGVNLDAIGASGLKMRSEIVDFARVIVENGTTRRR